ncbi:MAG: MFS transporter [Candidatus Lokiarchaeota archaeon]|nr:MFS transporter [Candidatus Lokiarchaeota archaeon]
MSQEESKNKFSGNIWKFYLYAFIFGIHTVRGVYYPYMTVWGGLTFFEMMLLQSYFMFMIFILEIPSGAIADHLSRKTALALSALCVVSAAFTYSIFPNIFLFLLAETLWAFGIALSSGTDEAFMYSTLKMSDEEDKLPKILGRTQFMYLIANVISAPLGSVIAEVVSLKFTMTCLGLIYIGAFLTSLTFKEPKFKREEKTKSYLTILKDGFNELKKNKILRILCFDRLYINICIYLLFWTYQPYLAAVNIPIVLFGFILAGMNIFNAIFNELIPRFLKKVNKKKDLLIFVNLISGFAFVILGFAVIPLLGIFMLFLIVGFGYTRGLIYIHGINTQIESENRATVLSTINMFGSISRAILYPFIGLVVEWNLFAMFIIIGIMILILTAFTRVKSEYL